MSEREFPYKDWLARVPAIVADLERRWSLTLDAPFEGASCAWVAPAVRTGRTRVVLKLPMPHFEAEHESAGLRFWDGDPTVRLLETDDATGAMLLERCEPGSSLRELPEAEQDVVIAGLLRRLWRVPSAGAPFRPLSAMTDFWSEETVAASARWPDDGLVRQRLDLFQELSRNAPTAVVLGTDVHAGNVLRAQREPWLVIDPKPFTGDPAYDATQHLLNCGARMRADPDGTIRRFSDLLGVDHERVRLWMLARAAVDSIPKAQPAGTEPPEVAGSFRIRPTI